MSGVAALALDACTSTPSASGGGHHHHHGGSTTTSSTTSTSTSTTTSTTAVPPGCTTAALALSTSFGGTAAGTSYDVFTLTDKAVPCSLEGYPTVTFYGPAQSGTGPRLPISDIDSGPVAKTVSLTSGGAAEFIVVYHDVPVGGVGCSTVASAEVSLPGTAAVLATPISISVCGGSAQIYAFGPPNSEHP
jgi:hypothetical protein